MFWDNNGFYLTQSEKNDRIEITEEEWEYLLSEQRKGKEIFAVNGEMQVRERIETELECRRTELNELKQWFNDFYTYKEQKYRRLITLEKTEDGLNPKELLIQLYKEAEEKRKRIQDLESILEKGE